MQWRCGVRVSVGRRGAQRRGSWCVLLPLEALLALLRRRGRCMFLAGTHADGSGWWCGLAVLLAGVHG
eukprot:13762228-Alexandrium_andersonii.AAC.1